VKCPVRRRVGCGPGGGRGTYPDAGGALPHTVRIPGVCRTHRAPTASSSRAVSTPDGAPLSRRDGPDEHEAPSVDRATILHRTAPGGAWNRPLVARASRKPGRRSRPAGWTRDTRPIPSAPPIPRGSRFVPATKQKRTDGWAPFGSDLSSNASPPRSFRSLWARGHGPRRSVGPRRLAAMASTCGRDQYRLSLSTI
jgi:hypothetical protein